MKAIVYDRYGASDVLRLDEIELPALASDGVRIALRAAAVNPYDWHLMRGEPAILRLFTGLLRPRNRRLGVDFAGKVEAVGRDVTRFRLGDAVFGMVSGAFAESLDAPESALAHQPANLSHAESAALPLAGLTALQGLRDSAGLQSGERVLIIGASGGVGTCAIPIAKGMGAQVTGVCSGRNLELLRSLGADHVIDYTEEDFTRSGLKYDVIFQLAGTHPPGACRRALTPRGRLVLSSGDSPGRWLGPVARLIKAAALTPFVGQKLVALGTKRSRADLEHLARLCEAGQLKPIIDRTYALAEVPEAIRHVERGHTRGKVVITV